MRGADLLMEMLIAHDVDLVFGVPGDTNVALYDALRQAQGKVRHVMVRDERTGGFMADCFSRLSGKPAVMEVPSGAGAMYALPAVAEANFSSLPMILITSDTPLKMEAQGVITELECAKLFEPVTKGSWQVKSAGKIPEYVRRAFRVATTGRPGAVHLVLPEDVLGAEVDPTTVSLHADRNCTRFPAYPASPRLEDVSLLANMIGEAKKPLLIAGGGVNRGHAGTLLRRTAERFNVPVVNTITGQSALADDHPLAIGVIGDNGFHPHANRAVEDADLLVYLGCRMGSVVTVGWTFPTPRAERLLVQVDIDPVALGNNSDNALNICADVNAVLAALLALEAPGGSSHQAWIDQLNAWRGAFWQHVQPELTGDSVPLKPQRVVKALNAHLEKKPYSILSDPGTPTPHMTRLLRLSNPDSTFIIPRAFGGLGYALPAVVGAWLARPEIRPVGLFGDGSFAMSMGELETIVRLDVPALLIHFSNGCFGWIKALQRLHGHNATYSVDFKQLDAAAIAAAFGLRAWHVRTADELDAALGEAFAHDGPAFIDIEVESIADVAPPVMSWLRRLGRDPLDLKPEAGPRLADRAVLPDH
ncbi:thiamine pyrophosphate-binding protein [Mesorhizobium sp. B2-7-1]|uniref:thiamine pyrophosphate-binding protein n=1 Tax=Mesorhizobium sp. B2-7-1 TaxID=2589909 RepID=UPI00112C2E0F|nr:thiamine pyrophosphate-binding protein [Mesorhizobium sp. B2-7-1]TPJ74583.1 thiamine pyrophosphate-binding protein [Mesorhizobium sp. B2-7-1]